VRPFSPGARVTQWRSIARGAADWLVENADPEGAYRSLHSGQAGLLLALEEAAHVRGDDSYARSVAGGLHTLNVEVEDVQDSSVYFGLAGLAFARAADVVSRNDG
jgi:hypothetical protein